MLSRNKLETIFAKELRAARHKLVAGDFDNAVRRASFALGIATALDCNERKTLAAELLSELALESPA